MDRLYLEEKEFEEFKAKLIDLVTCYLDYVDKLPEQFKIDLTVYANDKKLFDVLTMVAPIQYIESKKQFVKKELECIKKYKEKAIKELNQ